MNWVLAPGGAGVRLREDRGTSVASAGCADVGTQLSRLRMTCVRQRCQLAPGSIAAIAFLSPSWASEVTGGRRDRHAPPAAQEGGPGGAVLAADHVDAEDLALSTGGRAGGDDRADVDDETFDPAYQRLLAGGIATWTDPEHARPGEIGTRWNGRGVYFRDPAGHDMELMTRAPS